MQILATHLSDNAVDFREIDYTSPTCILMGQEKTGITQEAWPRRIGTSSFPMIGMVQSLNVSVASALILYEAQRQRQNAGMYLRENSMLPEAEQQRLLFEGGYPVLAKVAKRKGLPCPRQSAGRNWKPMPTGGPLCKLQGRSAMKGRLLDAVPLSSLTGVGAALSNKLAKSACIPCRICSYTFLRYEDRTHLYPSENYYRAFMPRWKAKC